MELGKETVQSSTRSDNKNGQLKKKKKTIINNIII